MIVVVQTLVYFRESIFSAINKALGYLSLSLGRDSDDGEDEEFEEVFSDYDEKTGVVFFPPVYLQRYAAVLECLMDKRWRGKIEKVVDFGYNDASFINHLKALPDIKTILGVDLEALPLECAYNHLDTNMKENMKIGLYQGNAADPDYRLIGCDAVVAIEMIEHMLPHDLDRLVHNIFGFIKPQLVVITTPNGDFNVLFKALMSNGLRRLDHYFEWSRTQFHEWCSNIVTRYPLYTVTCKGIGPGPEGTEHLGCCSQLALFVSNDYRKQLDLDINSLVQVSEVKNSEENSSSEWKDTGTDLDTVYSSLDVSSSGRSSVSFESSFASIETLYKDNIIQCDLDLEYSKDYLMSSDEDLFLNVLRPRKMLRNRIYIIEDISCRLNCTISHVKRYLKDTMDLITKNSDSPLFYMKSVVGYVNDVTKKSDLNTKKEGPIWNNINWGNNTPYWNQYYKVVKEWKYPFEDKQDKFDILNIISEEVDRIVQENKDLTDQIVIPMSRVMDLVKDVTDDEAYVREYFEWNDCELIDDMLLFPRPLVETTEDVGNDVLNIKSDEKLKVSKTNTCRYISHLDETEIDNAIQNKVQRLKFLMNGDDFSKKIENVIYRLASVGLLHSSRCGLPDEVWFKWRLLNMLYFTERSVDRSRRFFVETYQLGNNDEHNMYADESLIASAFRYFKDAKESFDILIKYKNDTTTDELFNKYNHLLHPKDKLEDCMDESFSSSLPNEPSILIKQRSILTDSQSCHSLLEGECDSLGSGDPELLSQDLDINSKGAKYTLKEFHAIHFDKMEIKKSVTEEFRADSAYKGDVNDDFSGTEVSEIDYNAIKYDSGSEAVDDSIVTNCDYQEGLGVLTPVIIDGQNVATFAKPIPTGIIELCKIRENNYNPDLALESDGKKSSEKINLNEKMKEEMQEDSISFSVAETATIDKSSKFGLANQSDNIFLFDENEPSTSKGIRRHNIRMDAQCGSDTEINASMLNILPLQNSTGAQIHSSLTNLDSEAIDEMQNAKINYFEKPIVIKESSSSINVTLNLQIENESIVSARDEITPEKIAAQELNSQDSNIIESSEENSFCNSPLERVAKNTKLEVISKVNDNHHDENETDQVAHDGKLGKEDIKPLTKLDINVITTAGKPKLCRGAIQMHNFSEKQSCEDIIFQGNWLAPTVKELPKTKSILIRSTKKIQPKNLSKENLDLRNVIDNVNNKRKNMNDKTLANKSPIGSPKKVKHTAFNYLQKSVDVHELTTVTKITVPSSRKQVKATNPQKLPSRVTVKRTSKTKISQNSDKKLCTNKKRSLNTIKKPNKDGKENTDQETISSDNCNSKFEYSEQSQEIICGSSSNSSCSSSPNSLETVRHNTQSKSSFKNMSVLSFENQSLIDNSEENVNSEVNQIFQSTDDMKGSITEHTDLENVSHMFTRESVQLFENNSMCNLQLNNSEEILKPEESQNSEQIENNLKPNEFEEISLTPQISDEEVAMKNVVEVEADELKLNSTEDSINDEKPDENETLVKSDVLIHDEKAKIITQDEMLINSSSKVFGECSRATSSPTPSDRQVLSPRSVDFSIKESAPSESSEYMTVVDFETGSVDVIRKTTPDFDDSTSSVASYFSCNIDDTLTTSHGLFQNSDHNLEDVSSSFSTIVNAGFDENPELSLDAIDNGIMEAGAGDGRGIHSDSQNSTGIDTSLNSSTSDISSGPITDAMTVHESSLSGDYDLLEENRSIVLQGSEADNQYNEDPLESLISGQEYE